MDAGVPHLSPPDTDVEDHDDNGLGDAYEEDMVDEDEDEDEDDDWQEDQIIEVRWRDGLTGLNRVQVLGHTGTGSLEFPGDAFQSMNMDEVFGSFRRAGGSDRRRTATYRALAERPSGERGGAFHHPLLIRPPPAAPGAVGSTTSGTTRSSLWASTAGSIVRDAEAMLGGGALDVTHFYMYDGPMPEHPAEGIFAESGGGGPAPPLLDFSMDPLYLLGQRGGRTDGPLSNWTDDGQLQAGAHAAAVAQAIEQQFISQLQTVVPGEDSSSTQLPAQISTTPAHMESTEATVEDATENMVEGAEPEASTQADRKSVV